MTEESASASASAVASAIVFGGTTKGAITPSETPINGSAGAGSVGGNARYVVPYSTENRLRQGVEPTPNATQESLHQQSTKNTTEADLRILKDETALLSALGISGTLPHHGDGDGNNTDNGDFERDFNNIEDSKFEGNNDSAKHEAGGAVGGADDNSASSSVSPQPEGPGHTRGVSMLTGVASPAPVLGHKSLLLGDEESVPNANPDKEMRNEGTGRDVSSSRKNCAVAGKSSAEHGDVSGDRVLEEVDLSVLRGMRHHMTPEEKMRLVAREEDTEDLNALAEIVPGLISAHEAMKRNTAVVSGVEQGSVEEAGRAGVAGGTLMATEGAGQTVPSGAEEVWRRRDKGDASMAAGNASGGVSSTTTTVDERGAASPTGADEAAGEGTSVDEEDSASISTASNHAKLSKSEWVAAAAKPANGMSNVVDSPPREQERQRIGNSDGSMSTVSSKKTFSAGSRCTKSDIEFNEEDNAFLETPGHEDESPCKSDGEAAEQRRPQGRGKRDKLDRSPSSAEPPVVPTDVGVSPTIDPKAGGHSQSFAASASAEMQDEVPAPPPPPASLSGVSPGTGGMPQTMPMYLPTFKPATGCTNASDFIVRCFVARLRSGITVVKHGRSRWCKSRLRILHIHPDGRSLSWKPALGEPTSSKRPPKLDLSTCLEVRHAWSPDPLHPLFTGTPILRQKCEAANAHKSFALIFPKRTVDVTAVTADQCKVLMEGFSALCFRLQVANLAGRQKEGTVGLDEGQNKEGSEKGKGSEGKTASETSSPPGTGMVRRSRFQ